MTGVAWGSVRGFAIGVAAFAVAAAVLLGSGAVVPPWLLPALVGAGVVAGAAMREREGNPLGTAAPRALRFGAIAVVAMLVALLAWGAVATPDRDWDGIVAWSLKAQALAAMPTLQQPLFAAPAVLHHSPDYPLTQPLCLAALAHWLPGTWPRLWLPLLYVALVLVVGLCVRRRTGDGALACWCALGVALTPQLIGTGGGSVDSGYADAFEALALAMAAAALLLGDALLLGAAAALLPLVKPEGLPQALALTAATLVFAGPRLRLCAAIGCAAGLAVELPLQRWLVSPGAATPLQQSWPVVVGVGGAAAAALVMRWAIARVPVPRRALPAVSVGAVAIGVVTLLLARPTLAASGTVLSHYLAHLDRGVDRLPQAPAILLGLGGEALSPRRLGLLGWILLSLPVAVVAARGRQRGGDGADPALRATGAFLTLLALIVVAAFFLAPETDIDHHLRSSAPRLLLQLCGVGWLLVGALLPRVTGGAPLPRWLAAAVRTSPPR